MAEVKEVARAEAKEEVTEGATEVVQVVEMVAARAVAMEEVAMAAEMVVHH